MSDLGRFLDLAPAYVLGALDPDEVAPFEAAMSRWPELRREVESLRELQAVMATRDLVVPPARLKARLLERIAVQPIDRGARRRPSRETWLQLGLAASLVLAIGLGVQVRRLGRDVAARDTALATRDSTLAEQQRRLAALLGPEVQVVTLAATGDTPPGLTLHWNRATRTAVVHAYRLPAAPAGRAYQLWLIRDGQPVPSQIFNSGDDGVALVFDVPIPEGARVQAFAVTQEPAGGSAQPTSPILLLGRVSE